MPKFIVEGADESGENYQPDNNGAPFHLFCPQMQDWLPEPYPTREAAEAAREKLESLSYYARPGIGGLIKLYRLQDDPAAGATTQETIRHAMAAAQVPVATFTSADEFEAFTGVKLAAFNGVN